MVHSWFIFARSVELTIAFVVSIAKGPEASISGFVVGFAVMANFGTPGCATHISMQLPGQSVNTQGCVAKVSAVYFCPGSNSTWPASSPSCRDKTHAHWVNFVARIRCEISTTEACAQ